MALHAQELLPELAGWVGKHTAALATLQAKAAANPELAKQVAAEKAALLGNSRGGSGS